ATSRYDYIVSVLQLRLAAGNLDRTQLSELNNWLTLSAPTSPAVATPETLTPPSGGAPATPPGGPAPAVPPRGSQPGTPQTPAPATAPPPPRGRP
ncbi:MAG TPA: hypothetical protein VEC10_10125, partial [Steroidobacteraceae bacterium]|nr:hypothetical protein [Steroidobacteraceae bacterium]